MDALQQIVSHLTPDILFAIAYLILFAYALKNFTQVVFKKVVVSKTYVTFTRKDFVFILLYFSLFFLGIDFFLSSGILDPKIPLVHYADIFLRFLITGCAFGAAYSAKKSELFDEMA